MSFATRFASLGGTRGLATALALLVSAPVLAQTAPAQRPAAQPARPAAPAPGAAQPQPNGGPTVVQVKAEPSQPEWTKVCGTDQNTKT